MASEPPQAIIILGMHRSGTSALAGTLGKLGVRLPARLMGESEHNPKGHFEPHHIVAIHDRLLAAAGISWSSIEGLPEAWYRSDEARAYAAELAEAVRQDYADAALFVVKDPRMCRLMPLWRMVLNEVGTQACFVIPIRHPFEVAQSLETRDGLPLAQGYLSWLYHVLAAERETRDAPRRFVHFHDVLSDPIRTVNDLAIQLLGKPLAPNEGGEHNVAALIDPELRHHVANPQELQHSATLPPLLADVYDTLTALVDRPNERQAMHRLDKVSAALDPAVAFFASQLTASDAKIANLDRTIAEKNSQLLEQQDKIVTLFGSSVALDETIARLAKTIAELNGTVARLRGTVAALEQTVALQDERAVSLNRTIDAHKAQIDALNAQAEEIFQSTGWRLLAPLRWFGRQRDRLMQSWRRKS